MLHVVHAATRSLLTLHKTHLQPHNIASGEYTQHYGCSIQMGKAVQSSAHTCLVPPDARPQRTPSCKHATHRLDCQLQPATLSCSAISLPVCTNGLYTGRVETVLTCRDIKDCPSDGQVHWPACNAAIILTQLLESHLLWRDYLRMPSP